MQCSITTWAIPGSPDGCVHCDISIPGRLQLIYMICILQLLRWKRKGRCIQLIIPANQKTALLCLIPNIKPVNPCQISTILGHCKRIIHFIHTCMINTFSCIALTIIITFSISISIPWNIFISLRHRKDCPKFCYFLPLHICQVIHYINRYCTIVFHKIIHCNSVLLVLGWSAEICRIPFHCNDIAALCIFYHLRFSCQRKFFHQIGISAGIIIKFCSSNIWNRSILH